MPAFLETARQSFLLQMRGKVFLVMTVLSVVLPLFLAIPFFDSRRVLGSEIFQIAAYMSLFFSMLPFVTMFLATQAVGSDIDDRTSVYLFTRPVSRVSLLVGKWLAAILLSGVFFTIALSALFAVIAFGPRVWKNDVDPSVANWLAMLVAGWVAVVGYSAVGSLFAAFFRRPMIFAVLYIMVQEFASRLPPEVGIHSLTVAFPIRVQLYQTLDLAWRFEHMLVGTIDGTNEAERALMEIEPLLAVLKVVLVAMFFAGWIYSRREYDSRPRE